MNPSESESGVSLNLDDQELTRLERRVKRLHLAPSSPGDLEQESESRSECRAKRRFQELDTDLRGLHPGSMLSPSFSQGFGTIVAHNDDPAKLGLEIQSEFEFKSYRSADNQGVEVKHKRKPDDEDDDHDDNDGNDDLALFGPNTHPGRSEFTFSLTESNDEEFSNPFAGLYKYPSLGLGDVMGTCMGEARNLSPLFPSTTFSGLSPGRRRSRKSVFPREVVAWRAVNWDAGGGTGNSNGTGRVTGKDDELSIQGQCSEMGASASADGDGDALAGETGSSTGGGGKRQRRE